MRPVKLRGAAARGAAGAPVAVEPRIRRLAAEQLGVSPDDLVPEVSLVEDLAVDSLDLLELAMALETEFNVTLPWRRIDRMRTYRDLVEAVLASFDGRAPAEARVFTVRSRIVPAGGGGRPSCERAAALTPYSIQIIGEEAAAAGRGARLEMTAPAGTDDADLVAIRAEFAWLDRRGVEVSIHREPAERATR